MLDVGAIIPKCEISKFQGTFLHRIRPRNQFLQTQVPKFSYLKELLVTCVCTSIKDRLPFLTEGYKCTKGILETKYSKPCEVANTYMQCVINWIIHNSRHRAS